MEMKQIRTIIDLMSRNQLTEFELEKEDFKIRIAKGGSGAGSTTITTTASPSPELVSAPAPAAESAESGSSAQEGTVIHSPMVGTFYRSPSPDAPSFVDVGTEVGNDTTVCIIEAMKVMNEIKAEVSGKILEVLAENGKPVEFGQPLFRVKG
jgi:acetyl-CoA carboxylase biotin carboxyl carrier protein